MSMAQDLSKIANSGHTGSLQNSDSYENDFTNKEKTKRKIMLDWFYAQ